MWIILFAGLGFGAAVLLVARDRTWGRALGLGALTVFLAALITVPLASGGGGVADDDDDDDIGVLPTETDGSPGDDRPVVELSLPHTVETGEEFEASLEIHEAGAADRSGLGREILDEEPEIVSAQLVAPRFEVVSSPPESQDLPATFTWVLRLDRTSDGDYPVSVRVYDDTLDRASSYLGEIEDEVTLSSANAPASGGDGAAEPRDDDDDPADKVLGVTTDILGPAFSLFATATVTAVTTAYVKTIFDKRSLEDAEKRKKKPRPKKPPADN